MDTDTKQKMAFLFAGWLLGIFASLFTLFIKDLRERSNQRKALLTRISLILLDMTVYMEVIPRWRKGGGLDKFVSVGVRSDTRNGMPLSPPPLPKDFDDVIQRFGERGSLWGKNKVVHSLKSLQFNLIFLHQQYEGLGEMIKGGEEPSEQALHIYNSNLPKLREQIHDAYAILSPMMLSAPLRALYRIFGLQSLFDAINAERDAERDAP